jgi:hypothetical protein
MNTLTKQTRYRMYIIEPTERPYDKGFDFFPSDPGRDDDYDFDGEDYKYIGNVRYASTIEEAKNEIDCEIEKELVQCLRGAFRAISNAHNYEMAEQQGHIIRAEKHDKEIREWKDRAMEVLTKATALQNS